MDKNQELVSMKTMNDVLTECREVFGWTDEYTMKQPVEFVLEMAKKGVACKLFYKYHQAKAKEAA